MVGAPDRSNTPTVVVAVALMGLLATVGAAALGGYWANKSVERQLESERSAAIQDQRRQVYVDYLRATAQACDAQSKGDDTKTDATAIEVLNQQGRVLLIAGPSLHRAVSSFTHAVVFEEDPNKRACADNKNYLGLRDEFIRSAQPDLDQ